MFGLFAFTIPIPAAILLYCLAAAVLEMIGIPWWLRIPMLVLLMLYFVKKKAEQRARERADQIDMMAEAFRRAQGQ